MILMREKRSEKSAGIQKAGDRQKKERIKKDVRYQESQVTLGCVL